MILSRLDRRILAGCAVLAVLGVAALAVPRVLCERARAQAIACLDDSRGPVDASACDVAEADLARLAGVPWVKHDATYRYEELRARRALAAYDQAAFLAPSAAGLKPAADWVAREADVVDRGSSRLTMDELGAAVAAPNVGAAAAAHGDRAALRERYDHIGIWSLRLQALDAALFEGDPELVDQIAARYAEFDPRDADLRSAIGAALCLGPDPGRGLEMLARIPGDRAEKRYAAIARAFGEIRAVQEACGDLASIEPPSLPDDRHAGLPDAVEARAVLALQLAKGDVETREARAAVRSLLGGEPGPTGDGLDPSIPQARVALLAELVAGDETIPAADVAALARARSRSEPPLLPTAAIGVSRVLEDPRGTSPQVAPKTYAAAADRVRTLLAKAELVGPSPGTLVEVARAFEVQAALGFARAGDTQAALDAAARAIGSDTSNNVTGTLPLSVAIASGGYDAALGIVKPKDGKSRIGFDFGAIWTKPVTDADKQRVRDLQRTMTAVGLGHSVLQLALNHPEEAKKAIPEIQKYAEAAGDAALAAQAHLLVLASADASTVGGAADPLLHAIQGTDADRREARRAVYASRGSAPGELALYAIVLGRLAPEGADEADVETWLDAALAIDAPRFTMRQVAFARAVAARSRGHAASAASWERKLAALRAPFADPRRAVIARFLGM